MFSLAKLFKCVLICVCLCVLYQGVYAGECDLPIGIHVEVIESSESVAPDLVGEYITGIITVRLHPTIFRWAKIKLYVLNKTYDDGQCALKVYKEVEKRWKSLFLDYIKSGISPENLGRLAGALMGKKRAGIYVRDFHVNTYHGDASQIWVTPGATPDYKNLLAHENFHGLTYPYLSSQDGLDFYLAFVCFANLVHKDTLENPERVLESGLFWGEGDFYHVAYGLQNESEWGAVVFSDWVLGTNKGKIWGYIQKYQPEYVEYFNNFFKTNKSQRECSEPLNCLIEYAEVDPTIMPPAGVTTVINTGKEITFSQAQSQSIWRCCFHPYKGTATEEDFSTLQKLIDEVSPGLPSDASRRYRLMHADANHDNVIDWLCSYASNEGPKGVGDGTYMWNKENRAGTYTFIISGKRGDNYVEYKQDPYLTLQTMNFGSITQPGLREWRGKEGHAFGAHYFKSHSSPSFNWYDTFSERITENKQK